MEEHSDVSPRVNSPVGAVEMKEFQRIGVQISTQCDSGQLIALEGEFHWPQEIRIDIT